MKTTTIFRIVYLALSPVFAVEGYYDYHGFGWGTQAMLYVAAGLCLYKAVMPQGKREPKQPGP